MSKDDNSQLESLIAKRQAAEKAVEDAAPDLKEKAFEVMLQHLLSGERQPLANTRRRKKTSQPKSGMSLKVKKSRKPSGPQGLITELVKDGFYDEWRSLPDILERLRVGGHIYKQSSLSTPLRRLTQAKVLRRKERERDGGRKIWMYQKHK